MAKDVKRRFTVDLEISTGDAEKKVKQTVGNLKTILADLGSASDKFGYLKELADYLSQIDAELDRFQEKHGGEMFARIFGGLDSALRKEMEQTFGVARDQMAQLAAIREEFEQLKISGVTADGLKPLEQKIKSLYGTIGRLDDAKITGRGALETRLLRMESALDSFAIVFDGVRDKIKQGVGFSGLGSGDAGTGGAEGIVKFSNEVQQEIDKLEAQVKRLEGIKAEFKKVALEFNKIGSKGASVIADDFKVDLTVESVRALINEFDALDKAIKNGDKTSDSYYDNLRKMSDVIMKLKRTAYDLGKADEDVKLPFKMTSGGGGLGNLIGALSHYANFASNDYLKIFAGMGSNSDIDRIIDEAMEKIEKLKAKALNGAQNDGIGIDVGAIKKQIDELEEQIHRYEEVARKFEEIKLTKTNYAKDGMLSDDYKVEQSVDAIEKLVLNFKKAAEAKKQFEQAGDKSSVAYYENLVQLAKMAMQLIEVEGNIDDALEDQLEQKKMGRGNLNDTLSNYTDIADRFLNGSFDKMFQSMGSFIAELKSNLSSLQDSLKDATSGVESRGGQTGQSGGTGAGQGKTSGGSGALTDADVTSLENTIRSEAAALSAKLDNVLKVELVNDSAKDLQGTIEGIRASIDQISASIDNYKLSKDSAEKQSEVDVMKQNLTQLLNFVSDFNARKVNGKYQQQEISAAIMSDGTISTGYGEKGSVPWDRMASSLLSNLTRSLLVDVHSHPLHQFTVGGIPTQHRYANDAFSGSSGDLGAFRFSQQLGAQLSSMITGNIMRIFDLSKLSDAEMRRFRYELADIEKQYANTSRFSKYVGYDDNTGNVFYRQQNNLADQHKVTEIFELFMYKAFERIGKSRDQVDKEIFQKYNLTDDKQLTALAERLVQLMSSAQSALSPVERLAEIITQFGGDTSSDRAKVGFEAYQKGEITAAEVFNKLNGRGYTVNQDTIDSLFRIDSAHEITAVESFLAQITSALDVISASVSGIEHNTKPSVSDNFDSVANDILALRNGLGSGSLTKGVKSIFDPLNVSEFKTEEVFKQSEQSAKAFETLLKVTFARAMNDGIVDFEALKNLLTDFSTAIAHTEDAIKQTELYKERTKEDFASPTTGEIAKYALENQLDELLNSTNTSALLYLLSQAKIDLAEEKSSYAHGLGEIEPEDNLDDNQISAQLQGIKSILDSIYGVLKADTGIEAHTKNSVAYKEPAVDTAVQDKALGEQDLAVLHSILEAIRGIENYLHSNDADDPVKKTDQDENAIADLANLIRSALAQPYATEATLQAIKASVDSLYSRFVQTDVGAGPATTDDNEQIDGSYALESTLQSVKGVLDSILSALKSDESITNLTAPLLSAVQALQNVANGIAQQQNPTSGNTNVPPAGPVDPKRAFIDRMDRETDRKDSLDKRIAGLSADASAKNNVSAAINDYATAYNRLEKAIDGVKNASDLTSAAAKAAVQEFNAAKKQCDEYADALNKVLNIEAKIAKNKAVRTISGWSNSLTKEFKTLDFKVDDEGLSQEQQDIADTYQALVDTLAEYKVMAANGAQVSTSAIEAEIAALRTRMQLYKETNNIGNARGTSSGKTYGETQLQNFTAKKNSLVEGAKDVGLDDDAAAVKKLTDAYERLVNAQKAFKVGEDLTTDAGKAKVDAFKKAQLECNKYARELGNIVDASKKLEANGFESSPLDDSFTDDFAGRKAALKDYVATIEGADTANAYFKNGFNQMVFTVKNVDGTFTTMTASINAARTAIVATAGDTKNATSSFMSFVSSVGSKFKELWVYTASRLGVDEIIQAVRTGITYIRDIDAALTELKKVTNETDAAYDQFLQNMSKTAGTIGSTVAELTTMAAEWARLNI